MDRLISIWTVVVVALWATGGALVLTNMLAPEWRVGNLGLYLTCAAAAMTVCRAIQVSHRAQRNAFELGREAERHGGVRQMRR